MNILPNSGWIPSLASELWREMTKWNSFTNTRRESNIAGGLQSLHSRPAIEKKYKNQYD